MFGKEKKEKDRITEINFSPAIMYFMSVKTEQGGNTVVPITTNLSESEIRTLIEGYIAQKGEFEGTSTEFSKYVLENGYYCRMPNQWTEIGPLVRSNEWQIYKK